MQNHDHTISPGYRIHPNMPKGVPPETKTWGQLMQWVDVNGILGRDRLNAVNDFQLLHHLQLVGAIPEAQSQSEAKEPGPPGGDPHLVSQIPEPNDSAGTTSVSADRFFRK
jgi:hypothetical protein